MKERPILFTGPMVRAILEGRKTQTRRVVKPQPFPWAERFELGPYKNYGRVGDWIQMTQDEHRQIGMARCPFGAPGDRLWVKETWRPFDSSTECACYDDCRCASYNGKPVYRADFVSIGEKWMPSIHMPRWASRITLEIEAIRVERLRDISDRDAMDEGYDGTADQQPDYEPRIWFKDLWQSIHGPGSWDANPWVWVIQFRRVKP